MKTTLSAAAWIVTALALAPNVGASPLTTTFDVKLVVLASCDFATGIGNIDLGSHSVNKSDVQQTTEMRVNCTNGATGTIKLISANGWKLKEKGGDATIDYKLYDSSGAEWNQTGRGYTSTGSQMVYQIKAKVGGTGNKAGTFNDTVTVQVDY